MIALVTYPYRDRETLAVHLVGEEVELTDERFAELSRMDMALQEYAGLPPAETEAAEEPVEGEADEGKDVVDNEPEPPAHEKPSPEMTVQQLRDAIETANGFAPRKATKAELIAILETL